MKIGNGYRFCMMGEVGDRVRENITGAFGVPSEHATGMRGIVFCAG